MITKSQRWVPLYIVNYFKLLTCLFLTWQEAIKCMRHSKRTVLTADDMDSALNLRNIEVYITEI